MAKVLVNEVLMKEVLMKKEKKPVKKEMKRARLLGIKAEQERGASVNAKKVALGKLQAVGIMQDESKYRLHKLLANGDPHDEVQWIHHTSHQNQEWSSETEPNQRSNLGAEGPAGCSCTRSKGRL
jgi:hypothetical protein